MNYLNYLLNKPIPKVYDNYGGINLDRFNEFYMLQSKAKDLERKGQDDQALAVYTDIIENYLPNNDFSFERAATLLEKKNQFQEALEVCNKAIELIKNKEIEGSIEHFEHKIERLVIKVQAHKKDSKVIEKEDFHFGVPGFRAHNKVIMIVAALYYIGTLAFSLPNQYFRYIFFVSLAFALDYFWDALGKLAKRKPLIKSAAVFLIATIICIYSGIQIMPEKDIASDFDNTEASDSESTGTGTGSSADSTDDTDKEPPEIPEKYIEAITNTGNNRHFVENTFVLVEDFVVYIDLYVEPSTSAKNAKRVLEDMSYELGSLMESEGVEGPSDKSYGEVFDYYTVMVTVSSEFDENYIKGALSQGSSDFKWTEEED